MEKLLAVLVVVAIALPISTSAVSADPPNRKKLKAAKVLMNAEYKNTTNERRLAQETRKKERKLVRQDRKRREWAKQKVRKNLEEVKLLDRRPQKTIEYQANGNLDEREGKQALGKKGIDVYRIIEEEFMGRLQIAKISYKLESKSGWHKKRDQMAGLLSRAGLAEYVYKFLGDSAKRYIQVGKDGKEKYSETGKKVEPSHHDERRFAKLISDSAKKHSVPEARIYAVIRAESGFNPRAISPAGAKGLMQLMPETARELGVRNSFDPKQNIDGGTKYLAMLYAQYNNWSLAHAAYNAGPGNVRKYGGKVPPFKETKTYVARVNRYHAYYRRV